MRRSKAVARMIVAGIVVYATPAIVPSIALASSSASNNGAILYNNATSSQSPKSIVNTTLVNAGQNSVTVTVSNGKMAYTLDGQPATGTNESNGNILIHSRGTWWQNIFSLGGGQTVEIGPISSQQPGIYTQESLIGSLMKQKTPGEVAVQNAGANYAVSEEQLSKAHGTFVMTPVGSNTSPHQKVTVYNTADVPANFYGTANITVIDPSVKITPVNVNPTPSNSLPKPKPPKHCIPGSLGYYGCPVPKPANTGVVVTQTDESETITMSNTPNPPSTGNGGTQVVY